MSAYVVYIDVLFLLNFCLDFILLAASGRLMRRRVPLWRLLLAAVMGAFYGIGLLFPALSLFYYPAAAVLVSLLLIFAAYGYHSAVSFLKLTASFYLVAFAMGGAVLAGSTLINHGVVELGGMSAMKAVTLAAAVPVAAIIGRRGYTALRRGWSQEDFCLHLQICVAGRSCELTALLDTGNDLREPLSGRPVVVVAYRDVMSLFPQRLRVAYESHSGQPEAVLQAVGAAADQDGWARRLRLIPFASIGQRYGLMLGFRPDQVILQQDGKRIVSTAAIAISSQLQGNGQKYQAVVNPELLNTAVIEEASA